jgi:uncharacterized membrane protein YjfL (UPF0719 family)
MILMAQFILDSLQKGVLGTILYSVIGIIMCVFAFKVVDWLIPGKLSKQISDDKNLATAIVAGSMILGICIIIAAAIAG